MIISLLDIMNTFLNRLKDEKFGSLIRSEKKLDTK